MPEEHTYNQPPGFKPESQQNVAPEASNQASHSVYPQANNVEQKKPAESHRPEAFSDFGGGNSKSIAPSVLVWMAFVIALALTGYFWLMDYSNVKNITEKENEKNQITAQLSSAANKDAEDQAQGFSTAFSELSNLIANSVPKSTILTELYANITKDVKISTIALSSEGGLSLNGATGSYRQAADFMLGLKSDKRVSNLVLKSVALDTGDGVAANQKVKFSISADIQMAKEAAATTGAADGSSASQSGSPTTTTAPAAAPPAAATSGSTTGQ